MAWYNPPQHCFRPARRAFLFGASLLLTLACTGSDKDRAPTSPSTQFRLSDGASLHIVVNTVITTTGPGGKSETSRLRTSKTVIVGERPRDRIHQIHDRLQAKSEPVKLASLAKADPPTPSAVYAADTDPSLAGLDFVPITAVTSGDYTGVFDVTDVDSVGNQTRTVATSPAGQPISSVTIYLNGAVLGSIQSNWIPVSGGYILASQSQINYTEGQTVTNIFSTVEAGQKITYASAGGIRGFLAQAFKSLGRSVGCALTPATAYAQTGNKYCWQQGVVLGGVTLALGIHLYAAYRNPLVLVWGTLERAAFYTEVAAWTYALHDYLHCMGGQNKTNPPAPK